jgi:hypothetical protein
MKEIKIKIEKNKTYNLELSDRLYTKVTKHLSSEHENSVQKLLEALLYECSDNIKLEDERSAISEKLQEVQG